MGVSYIHFMALIKYKVSFILESRKDPQTKSLITDNVPILMVITYSGKRLFYYTGYRTDTGKWISKTVDGDQIGQLRRNTVNKDNISASIINARLKLLETVVHTIFSTITEPPSIKTLRELIKNGLGETKAQSVTGLFASFEQYCDSAKVSQMRRRHLFSTKNRFEEFAATLRENLTFEKCTPEIIERFDKFLRDGTRSQNTISSIEKKLRAFFLYAVAQGITDNNPFTKFKIQSEVYGDPIYLTKQERDKLYSAKISNERLDRVRDMFILQCHLGCRVGDFVKLTKKNIVGNSIHYIPSKTSAEKQTVCKVPLSKTANEIISKYDIPDGSLVPYISDQRYNDYLKELFELEEVGLNRIVVKLNTRTQKSESVPLYKIDSSHMARRTFIGILHQTVKNEVITSMTGHSEQSKAFHRYYSIQEEDRIKAIESAN